MHGSKQLMRAVAFWAVLGCRADSRPPNATASGATSAIIRPIPVAPPRSGTVDTVIGALRFQLEQAIEGDDLYTQVWLRNVGSEAIPLRWDACGGLSPRLYRTPDRSGPPAFDWRARPDSYSATGVLRSCAGQERAADLAPGAALAPPELVVRLSIREIMGDSLAPARYFGAAWLQLSFSGTTTLGSAEPLELRGPALDFARR